MSWLALCIHVNCLLSCNHLHLERLTTTQMVDKKGARYYWQPQNRLTIELYFYP